MFALGPGHNVPLLGSTPGAAKGAVLLVAIATVASVVLVEAQERLARGQRARRVLRLCGSRGDTRQAPPATEA